MTQTIPKAMVSKALVAASTRPLILSVLAREEESYGYEIIQRIKAVSDGHLQWQDGMLYPVLHRMEREGLVATRWGTSERGRKRKYYRLQPAGRRALADEMQQWQHVHATLVRLLGPDLSLT